MDTLLTARLGWLAWALYLWADERTLVNRPFNIYGMSSPTAGLWQCTAYIGNPAPMSVLSHVKARRLAAAFKSAAAQG